MMYKGRYAVVTFLLFALSRGDTFRHTQEQQRYNSAMPSLSRDLAPPWEYMLREIILKSTVPSPLDASAPYKRPLDASFYGGPIAAYSNDNENAILSRGNIYRLLNGHWMLCQDGCVDCEPCAVQRNPLFAWILRRIRRNSDPMRHDLQLTIMTIMPEAKIHLHASNLWPNYYVYMTPQGERVPTSTITTQYDNGPENPLSNLENSFSEHHHRSKDLWRLTERDSGTGRDGINGDHSIVQENVSTEKTEEGEGASERKHRLRNMRSRQRPRPRPVEKPAEEAHHLTPRLILGTDQRGQKHLVHVVPADYPTITALPATSLPTSHPISPQVVEGQAAHSNNTIPKRERQIYQRIIHRVFDSLNTHRQSIENFLESPDNVDVHRISSSMDNMEVAGFSWNYSDINHKSANLNPFHLNDALLSPHVRDRDRMEEYQQYRNRYSHERMKQDNDYYMVYRDMNRAKILRGQTQTGFNLDLDKERRKVHIKPYSIDSKNISRVNSSTSLQNLDNYSLNATQKSDLSGFAINSAKQINLNDTFVEEANNNSMESSSITTKHENGHSERLGSGDVNREFEASRYAFRVIVTTESPLIRSEHETLKRTTVLQITTPKTFANSS